MDMDTKTNHGNPNCLQTQNNKRLMYSNNSYTYSNYAKNLRQLSIIFFRSNDEYTIFIGVILLLFIECLIFHVGSRTCTKSS